MPKPVSIKLAIMKALTDVLHDSINGGEEYHHDLASVPNSVQRGRLLYGDDDPVPLVGIVEPPVNDLSFFAGMNGETRADNWRLIIQGWVQDDRIHPTDKAYDLAADVEKALSRIIDTSSPSRSGMGTAKPTYPDDYMLGGLIGGLRIEQPICRPAQDGVSSKAFFYIPIVIQVATDIGK